MILFPAIDLKEGLAVRLEQGDMARATVFHRGPASQARAFEAQGFEYLHIADLDGGWLGKGVTRVIIGTAAVRDPAFVKQAAKAFPGRVAVGLDARDGKVAVEGWAEASELSVLDIARRFEDAGDGMLKGLNLDATIALAEAISIPVIASGGLASIEDVKAMLAPRARKLEGAIAGRALYDGRLDPAAALKLIRGSRAATAAS